MLIFKKSRQLRDHLSLKKQKARSIGFAPTMGALHKGHLSLIEAAKKENDITVTSIFVNPTQFNDKKDFEKYPVTIDEDIRQLELAGTDILFLPSVEEIYPAGTTLSQSYDLGFLETVLEGKFRPGHFQGVCQVVERLLLLVEPDHLYLGQKDYQQCMVINRLISLMKKEDSIKLKICPTLREQDGLAMSSRNMRLSASERQIATSIYQSLSLIKNNLKPGDLSLLKQTAINLLQENGFRIDYVEITDAGSLQPVSNWDGKQKLVALCAAFLNEVRLIDNLLLN